MSIEKRTELLEILKLYYQDYEYRHKTFWEIVFKSILAILSLIGLPYFLAKENFLTHLLFLFPTACCILCLISALLIESEAIRMYAVRTKYRNLLELLSNEYKEIPLKQLSKFSPLRIKITNQILILYFALTAVSVIQLILILTGKFV